jgi:hypothetical protein
MSAAVEGKPESSRLRCQGSSPILIQATVAHGFSIHLLLRSAADREMRAWCTTASVVFVIAFFAVAGNIVPRYLPAASAILPFMWRPLLDRRASLVACVLATIVSGGATVWITHRHLTADSEFIKSEKADETVVMACR